MGIDLRFEEGDLRIELFVFDLLVLSLGDHPALQYAGTSPEKKYQQKDGDRTGRQNRRAVIFIFDDLEIGRKTLDIAKRILVEPGHISKKNQEADDHQKIGNDFIAVQQSRDQYKGIEIVKRDITYIADEEEEGKRLRRQERGVGRSWKKDERQHQETAPGGDVQNYLDNALVQ